MLSQSFLSVPLLGTDEGLIACFISFLGSTRQDLLGPTVDNQGFSKNEIGEKIRLSGLLRLEEMGLEVLLVCPRAMQTTQDEILLTFSFGNPFLLTLTSFGALSRSLWCHLSTPSLVSTLLCI